MVIEMCKRLATRRPTKAEVGDAICGVEVCCGGEGQTIRGQGGVGEEGG